MVRRFLEREARDGHDPFLKRPCLTKNPTDVTVIGGGLAGMAAAIQVANAGLKVVCIEPSPVDSDPVGESLDWSAPALLKSLGVSTDYLLQEGIATYKRHFILKLRDGAE